MQENFEAYIDGLERLEDDDLYLDIDETMEKRHDEKIVEKAEAKNRRRSTAR